ncbi:unnamed protein product, partial [Iphiclides podalirius]
MAEFEDYQLGISTPYFRRRGLPWQTYAVTSDGRTQTAFRLPLLNWGSVNTRILKVQCSKLKGGTGKNTLFDIRSMSLPPETNPRGRPRTN